MKVDLSNFEIAYKIFLGVNLKIIFANRLEPTDRKVLDLKEVEGFIDNARTSQSIQTLLLDKEGGGSYNLDLSLRLKRKEINHFPEVFLFIDKACVDFCFRAVAKSIEFRNWTEADKWL